MRARDKILLGILVVLAFAVTREFGPRAAHADSVSALDGAYSLADQSSKTTAEVDSSGNLMVNTNKTVGVTNVFESDGATLAIRVAGTNTIYTQSIALAKGSSYALAYQQSGSNPITTLQIEQGYVAPTLEGGTDPQWTIPAAMADVDTARTGTTIALKTITPIALPYMRFKISGSGANAVSTATNVATTLRIRLGQQSNN